MHGCSPVTPTAAWFSKPFRQRRRPSSPRSVRQCRADLLYARSRKHSSPSPLGSVHLPPAVFAQSIDGRDLLPTRLWIEAEIQTLTIDRCILGPIRARGNGEIETLKITSSIVQAIATSNSPLLSVTDLKNPIGLAIRLQGQHDPISSFVWAIYRRLRGVLPMSVPTRFPPRLC